jgi:cytoskeletal protein RodZ
MLWVYILIGLIVVIGLIYWLKPKKEKEEETDASVTPQTPSETETPPETPEPAETEESSSSDEEKPM